MGIAESFLLYLSVYLLSAAFVHIWYHRGAKAKECILLAIALLLPSVLAGVRYGVGTDFYSYERMYAFNARLSFRDLVEQNGFLSGWMIWAISQIAGYVGGEEMFFGLYAFLTYIFFVDALRQYKNANYFLSAFGFLLLPFTAGLNGVRQALAVSIAFWSLKYVYQRNFFKYIMAVALAVMAHTTALVMVPVYFLYSPSGKKVWNFRAVMAVFGTAVMVAYMPVWIPYLVDINLFGLSHFSMYSERVFGRNYSFFLSLTILVVVILFQKGLFVVDSKYRLLIVMFAIGVCLEFSGYFSAYVKRISNYFSDIIDFLLLSQIPIFLRRGGKVWGYLSIAVYGIFVFFILYVILGQADVIPYRVR